MHLSKTSPKLLEKIFLPAEAWGGEGFIPVEINSSKIKSSLKLRTSGILTALAFANSFNPFASLMNISFEADGLCFKKKFEPLSVVTLNASLMHPPEREEKLLILLLSFFSILAFIFSSDIIFYFC
ncbi:MAG: hypothetical protein U5J96_10040 [Ignavibacteriaceae bacterium]|nr:hypothetical protein [Ignavibacteriaceae bacterium]